MMNFFSPLNLIPASSKRQCKTVEGMSEAVLGIRTDIPQGPLSLYRDDPKSVQLRPKLAQLYVPARDHDSNRSLTV